ncbi:MAG TPA: GGDEF domain-containing protein [Thermoanaerobaculia bacterium]|nr:GGDEF domain-containing protein [Thermoanaerobaculia bacterium]
MSVAAGAAPSFAATVAAKNLVALGRAGWLAVGFTIPFVLFYRLTFSGFGDLMVLLSLSCGLAGAILILLSRYRVSWARAHSGPLSILFFDLVGCALVLGGLLHGGYESSQYAGLIVAVAGVCNLFVWSWRETLSAFGAVYLLWNLPLVVGWIHVEQPTLAVEQQFFVLAALFLAATFARHRWLAERRQALVRLRCLRLAARARRQATTDPLTGLVNRRGFGTRSRRELSRSRRQGERLALVLVDVDQLKTINDRFGHAVGDRVLKHVAATIADLVRKSDLVARFGGDEFVILLWSADRQGAMAATERIRCTIGDTPVNCDGQLIHLTLSAGVAEIGPLEGEVEAAIGRADEALYRAKSAGRDRVASWRPAERIPDMTGELSLRPVSPTRVQPSALAPV